MRVPFRKYQAAGNDFLVIERAKVRVSAARRSILARQMCDRRTGAGADGLLIVGASAKADCRVDVFNADGGWAEKSGNGLRITALHVAYTRPGKRSLLIETGAGISKALLLKKIPGGHSIRTELGRPIFETAAVPVKTRQRFLINSPLKLGQVRLPVTLRVPGQSAHRHSGEGF
jgi:diaminopimelate epimerase